MASTVKKHRQRTIDKMHILIRAELANPLLNSTEVAALCGLSIWKFSVLKATPMYKQLHNAYHTGLLTTLDQKVNSTIGLTQETLNLAVPVAMQALLKQALQEKDLRVQNKACNDLLDRHGRFAKVTRIGAPTDEQSRGVAEDKDNKAVAEMVKALNSTNNSPTIPPAPSIDQTLATDTIQ